MHLLTRTNSFAELFENVITSTRITFVLVQLTNHKTAGMTRNDQINKLAENWSNISNELVRARK
jgi:hypothetical protein